jgi:hypothetical protein
LTECMMALRDDAPGGKQQVETYGNRFCGEPATFRLYLLCDNFSKKHKDHPSSWTIEVCDKHNGNPDPKTRHRVGHREPIG